MTSNIFFTFTKDTWVADGGASSHIINNDSCLEDVKITSDITHSNGGNMITKMIGKKKVHIMQTECYLKEIALYLKKYCNNTKSNLLSSTSMLSASWKIAYDNSSHITMTKNDVIINMDQCIKT